jgi:small acid-soluble spore protein D (minor alpha/beta-type SASP)
MARRSGRRPLVPDAEQGLRQFKGQVMAKAGYHVNPNSPDDVKYEVASTLGVPLEKGYNGKLSSASAGSVGGQIGGTMVREMVRLAQENLEKQANNKSMK